MKNINILQFVDIDELNEELDNRLENLDGKIATDIDYEIIKLHKDGSVDIKAKFELD